MKTALLNPRLLLACAVIAAASSLTLCSCLSPRAKEFLVAAAPIVVPLAKAAETSGHLPPGSSVIIDRGVAVITSSETKEQKVMALKTLGVETAVNEGLLKEGDKLIVDQAGEALVKIITAVEAANAPADPPGPVNPLLPPAPNQ